MTSLQKTQAELKMRQAEQAYRVLNYEKAIEALTEAIEIVRDYELYTFRSKCYTAASFTEEAINDANIAIEMEKEAHEGYFCRAEAEFFQGEFERALVDYSICQFKRPDIADHERGISKCEESIRKACECERVNEYIEWLDDGVFIEKSLFQQQNDVQIEVFSGRVDESDSECSTGLNTATLFNQPEVQAEEHDEFALLNKPSDKMYREISRSARRSQSYNRIGQMALDRAFLREVGALGPISDISKKGIDYIDQREEFWRNQSTNQPKAHQFRRNTNRAASVGIAARTEHMQNETARYRRKIAANLTTTTETRMNSTFYERAIRRNPALEKSMRELTMFIKQANTNITEAVNKQAYELAVEFCDQLVRKLTNKNDNVLAMLQARLCYLSNTYCIKACLEIKLQLTDALNTFQLALSAAEQSGDTHSLFKVNREYAKALMGMNYHQNARTQLKQLFSYTQDAQLQIDLNYNLAKCYFELKDYQNAADAGIKAYHALEDIFHDEFPETELPAMMEFMVFREPRVCDIACDLLCLLGRTFQQLADPRSREFLEKCCEVSRQYEDAAALRAAETALAIDGVQAPKTLPQVLTNNLAPAVDDDKNETKLRQLIDQQIIPDRPNSSASDKELSNGSAAPAIDNSRQPSGVSDAEENSAPHTQSNGGELEIKEEGSASAENEQQDGPEDDFEDS